MAEKHPRSLEAKEPGAMERLQLNKGVILNLSVADQPIGIQLRQ
jgi:hypothetical protein